MNISELNPRNASVIRQLVLELHRRPVKPSKKSPPVQLFSKTLVLVNPKVTDTENKVSKDDDNIFKTKKTSKSETQTEGFTRNRFQRHGQRDGQFLKMVENCFISI